EYSTEWIIAFDIESEKFRTIPVPPVPKSESSSYHPTFTVVDGCLAIVRRMEQSLKIWIFLDHNKENGTFITSFENDWTRLTIELPYDKMLHWSVILVHSVPGTDQIILETYGYPDTNCFGNSNIVRAANFYYYDRKKKTLKKLEINGDSSFLGYCRAKCSIFVENLLPVRKKLCSSSVPSLNAGKQSQESESSKLSTRL
ncbi:hypothetical protein MKW94_013443, partial [Papaver nudicaule]|nr:hypothetical protein [Papaver nudicaule]